MKQIRIFVTLVLMWSVGTSFAEEKANRNAGEFAVGSVKGAGKEAADATTKAAQEVYKAAKKTVTAILNMPIRVGKAGATGGQSTADRKAEQAKAAEDAGRADAGELQEEAEEWRADTNRESKGTVRKGTTFANGTLTGVADEAADAPIEISKGTLEAATEAAKTIALLPFRLLTSIATGGDSTTERLMKDVESKALADESSDAGGWAGTVTRYLEGATHGALDSVTEALNGTVGRTLDTAKKTITTILGLPLKTVGSFAGKDKVEDNEMKSNE